MKIISLGFGCQVKFQISKLHLEQETHFFDWIISDFKTVLHILKNINDDKLIIGEKFTDQPVFMPGKSWHDPFHKIECYDFKMITIHDFPSNKNYIDCMDKFVKRYNRRLSRIKKLINSDENIHMIHCIDHLFTEGYIINNDDINNFKAYLSNINPKNNCFLHIAIPPKYKNIDLNYLIQDKVYVYYLNDTEECVADWTNQNFNWKIIFDNINNLS